MEIFNNLVMGFGVAITPINLLYALIGCLLGTLIGVLPGIGPVATIAMLLPITFNLNPVAALIMLAGIYYGAQYGGSTTAILVNIPGESSSVVTCLDGYQMARQGRAGPALAVAALGSFFAGCGPGQHPRRIILGGHLPRRLPDGAPGPRRTGARRGGARLVLRRLRVDADHRARRAAARRGGAQVRPVGVLLADGVRPGGGDRAPARPAHQA